MKKGATNAENPFSWEHKSSPTTEKDGCAPSASRPYTPRKHYTDEFKKKAVDMYFDNPRSSIASVARELKCSTGALNGWIRLENREPGSARDKLWAQIEPLMGYYPDITIAKKFGVTASQVTHRRHAIGIEAWRGQTEPKATLRHDKMHKIMLSWSRADDLAFEIDSLKKDKLKRLLKEGHAGY